MYGRARFMFLQTLIQVQNENKQKKSNFKNHLGFMRLVLQMAMLSVLRNIRITYI